MVLSLKFPLSFYLFPPLASSLWFVHSLSLRACKQFPIELFTLFREYIKFTFHNIVSDSEALKQWKFIVVHCFFLFHLIVSVPVISFFLYSRTITEWDKWVCSQHRKVDTFERNRVTDQIYCLLMELTKSKTRCLMMTDSIESMWNDTVAFVGI